MLRRTIWIVVVALAFVFANACLLASPRVFASSAMLHRNATFSIAQTRANLTTLRACSATSAPTVLVSSNHWKDTTYLCGTGYVRHEIDGVNEVYNETGGPLWFKWYRGNVGHYCAVQEEVGGYQNFHVPVKITQIDYGERVAFNDCGSQA